MKDDVVLWMSRRIIRLVGPVVIAVVVGLSAVAQQPEPPIEQANLCMNGVCPEGETMETEETEEGSTW